MSHGAPNVQCIRKFLSTGNKTMNAKNLIWWRREIHNFLWTEIFSFVHILFLQHSLFLSGHNAEIRKIFYIVKYLENFSSHGGSLNVNMRQENTHHFQFSIGIFRAIGNSQPASVYWSNSTSFHPFTILFYYPDVECWDTCKCSEHVCFWDQVKLRAFYIQTPCRANSFSATFLYNSRFHRHGAN